MKTTIQKTLHASLCLAILFSLVGSTMSYGMEQEMVAKFEERIKINEKLKASEALKYLSNPTLVDRWLPVKADEGTPENNALLWIKYRANIGQLDLLERMNKEQSNFRPRSEDKVYFDTMPSHVRTYLNVVYKWNI